MNIGKVDKTAVSIVYRAEITSEVIGKSVAQLLHEYSDALLDLEPKKSRTTSKTLLRIASKLEDAVDKDKVYKGLIPSDILEFIKSASEKGVKSSSIFKEYAPIKEIGEKALKKFQTKMYFPFIIFVVATFGFNFLVAKFIPIADGGSIPFSETSKWVMHNFLAINFIYGAMFAFVFFVIPRKVPLIKKVFDGIEGMLAMSTIIILYKLSYSSAEIIPILVKRFNLQKLLPREKGIDGLTQMLYRANYISILQASEIRNSGSVTGELGVVLDRTFEEKREEVLLLDEILQEVIKNITIFLIAVPLGFMLYVLANLFGGVMSLV